MICTLMGLLTIFWNFAELGPRRYNLSRSYKIYISNLVLRLWMVKKKSAQIRVYCIIACEAQCPLERGFTVYSPLATLQRTMPYQEATGVSFSSCVSRKLLPLRGITSAGASVIASFDGGQSSESRGSSSSSSSSRSAEAAAAAAAAVAAAAASAAALLRISTMKPHSTTAQKMRCSSGLNHLDSRSFWTATLLPKVAPTMPPPAEDLCWGRWWWRSASGFCCCCSGGGQLEVGELGADWE